jgi:hypothetical protein
MKLLELMPDLRLRREFGRFDDFLNYASGQFWTSLTTDAGVTAPAVQASGAGGILSIATGATANNQVAWATTAKPFLFAAEKPLVFEVRLQYAEANTSDAGVAVGFGSAIGAETFLLDTTLLPAASFSGAIIYKSKGQTQWSFRTSVGATNTDTQSQHTAGGSAYHVLRIEVRLGSTGVLEAVPFFDGQPMLDTSAVPRPIKHRIDYTSAAAMQAGAFLKAGGSNSETLLADYAAAYQLR